MDRSILVTGAQGLVGAWLSRALLAAGARITSIEPPRARAGALDLLGIATEVDLAQGDVRDPDAVRRVLAERRVDTVFHLAAQSLVATARRAPSETFDVNIRGTWTVLEAAREQGVQRVVVASTDKAYGPDADVPFHEDVPLGALYPYDVSKAAADLIARSYWHTYGLPVAVTRFSNVYGGGDTNRSRLIPEAIAAALDGRTPVIRSDGTPARDYLYVDDAVAGYLAIDAALGGGGAAGQAFNAGSGKAWTVDEVLAAVCRVAGVELHPRILGTGTPAGELGSKRADSSKLTALTGWRPRVDLEDGLGRTLAWYREHPEALADG